MTRILDKTTLAPDVTRYVMEAPKIARKRQAGQFILLRVAEGGERIPLTIADADPEAGTVTIVVQKVGKTTAELELLEPGDEVIDFVGPLGTPTHIERFGTAVCIGGGIGVAPMHPIAGALKQAGNEVITIIGARNEGLLIMREEMARISDELLICTDDGSAGEKGFVSMVLERLIGEGRRIDLVVAIGPAIMMKVCCDVTRPHGIKTLVSLNPIMVDGTGMCGGCRVEVGGESKFCCVDGPEFDGHLVDFDLLLRRQAMYKPQEKLALETFQQRSHECRLDSGVQS